MNSTKELNEDRRAAISSRANVGPVSANWVLNAPQNWTVTTLQKILQVSSGDFLGPDELLDEGYPVFGGNGLRGYYSAANSPPSTMLIGRYGALCGNVHIPVNKCWATEHAFRVRPLTKFNQRFVARYIEALELRHLATRAAQPGLNSRMVREQAVALPDLPIQKAIADFLDRETARIDQLIEKKKRMVEVLGERLCAEREALVWVHSKFAKLGHHVSILSGYPFPSDGFSDDPLDARLLRGANVGVDTLRWDDVVYWPADDCERLKRFRLEIGDLVMGMDRPWISGGMRVATVGPDDVPSFLLQRVCKIKPRATMNGMFLKELLHSRHFVAHFEPILTGVSVPHISPDQIAGFRFPYIDPDVQASQMEHFAKLVHWVRRVIYRTKTSIDRLREYRSALITAAVTGQIDVSTWGKQGTTDRRLDQIEETAST